MTRDRPPSHAGRPRAPAPDERTCDHSHRGAVPRRAVLRAGGVAAAAVLAGCSSGSSSAPDPITLTGSLQCDVCGMVIESHPGPDGQIFYADNSPANHDNPARFDSLKRCLFPYLFEHQQQGWTAAAIYATDYSSVEYTVRTEGDQALISSHPEASAFADATDLHYVVGSDVAGAMGPDFVPFSKRADADSFAGEYGGDVVAFDEIGPTLVGR